LVANKAYFQRKKTESKEYKTFNMVSERNSEPRRRVPSRWRRGGGKNITVGAGNREGSWKDVIGIKVDKKPKQ